MLAYEGEGARFTVDCLDCEKREDDWWKGEGGKKFKASSLTSDFSVQALILSATSSIDALDSLNGVEDDGRGAPAISEITDVILQSINKEKATVAFWRIGVARAELALATPAFVASNSYFVEFLFLRCAIEVEDDALVTSAVFGDDKAVKKVRNCKELAIIIHKAVSLFLNFSKAKPSIHFAPPVAATRVRQGRRGRGGGDDQALRQEGRGQGHEDDRKDPVRNGGRHLDQKSRGGLWHGHGR